MPVCPCSACDALAVNLSSASWYSLDSPKQQLVDRMTRSQHWQGQWNTTSRPQRRKRRKTVSDTFFRILFRFSVSSW